MQLIPHHDLLKTAAWILLLLISCSPLDVEGPDHLYRSFSLGYENLDADLIADLYDEKATLINLYQDVEPTSINGQSAIWSFFSDVFKKAKQEEKKLKIDFKVTTRNRSKDRILDHGFYHLKVFSADGEQLDRFGKFSIVIQRRAGKWKFMLDANASATAAEFDTSNANGADSSAKGCP